MDDALPALFCVSPTREQAASLCRIEGRRLRPGMADDATSDHGETLEVLLARCADGDRAAFRRLYDLQSARLYGQALRLTRQPQLAADAVHDAFLQVWQRSSRFDTARGRPEAWLASLLRYRAIDIMRKRGRETYGIEAGEEADTAPDALRSACLGANDGSALRRCLGELEDNQRRVVLMAFADGLTHAELATRLNSPLGTVKSWIRRALLSLRRCLEP